ncbi:MAG TPA: zf-HC2 domain-containing protein, partial [Gemmatimonadales bacterium]|nr:zf-HC2 domain-containing protein [Gemmatimonadales bacterium]
MRHIPEDELHAYLDQALSRSQCAEIERHLAACAVCQALRDDIAALRDRTTAILAPLCPELVIPPPYERLVETFAARRDRRRRWIRRGAWAATVLLALGVGWRANRWVHAPGAPSAAPDPDRPAVAVRPAAATAPDTARVAPPPPETAPRGAPPAPATRPTAS